MAQAGLFKGAVVTECLLSIPVVCRILYGLWGEQALLGIKPKTLNTQSKPSVPLSYNP